MSFESLVSILSQYKLHVAVIILISHVYTSVIICFNRGDIFKKVGQKVLEWDRKFQKPFVLGIKSFSPSDKNYVEQKFISQAHHYALSKWLDEHNFDC